MRNASPEYIAAVRSDCRSWRSRLKLTEGYVYGVEAVSYTSGSQATQGITVGAVVAPTLKLTLTDMILDTTSQAIELTGREVVWELGIIPDISDFTGGNPNSDYEFLPIGTFTVDKVKKNGTRWEAECSHKLAKADVPHTSALTYPTTAQVLAEEVCNSLGLTFSASLSPTISIEGLPEGATKRDILGWVAALYGGFIGTDNADNVDIAWYSDSEYTVPANAISTPEIAEKQTTYTAVTCNTSDDTFTYGAGNAMVFTCPFMTRERFTVLAPTLAGFSYRPCTVPFLLGDPLIEQTDIITLNYGGENYAVPAASISLEHKGGMTGTVEAKDGSSESVDRVDPITRAVNRLVKLIRENKDEIEQDIADAVREATEALRGGAGGYFYIIDDGDGTNRETIWCDNKDPDLATHGIRINTAGIGFWVKDPDDPDSTLFNGPYTQAWTIDGTLIADFIRAGVLSGIEIICTRGTIGGWKITDRSLESPDGSVRLDSTYDVPLTRHIDLRGLTHRELRELTHREIRYLNKQTAGRAQISAGREDDTIYMRDAALTVERNGSRLAVFGKDGMELTDTSGRRYLFVGRDKDGLLFDLQNGASQIEWAVGGRAVFVYEKGVFRFAGNISAGDISADNLTAEQAVTAESVTAEDVSSDMLRVTGRFGLESVFDRIEDHGGLNLYSPEGEFFGGIRPVDGADTALFHPDFNGRKGINLSVHSGNADFFALWQQVSDTSYDIRPAFAWVTDWNELQVYRDIRMRSAGIKMGGELYADSVALNLTRTGLTWYDTQGDSTAFVGIPTAGTSLDFSAEDIRWRCEDDTLWEYTSSDDTLHGRRDINMHGNAIINADIQTTSDERLKENIAPCEKDCLAVIRALGLISFDWKDTGEHEDIGFSAQQAGSISPDLMGEHNGQYTVNESRLIRYLVGAVQQLGEIIKNS